MSRPKSDRPTCQTCVFWRPLNTAVGLCQAKPPELGPVDENGQYFGVWPATERFKSCGTHQDMDLWVRQGRHDDADA